MFRFSASLALAVASVANIIRAARATIIFFTIIFLSNVHAWGSVVFNKYEYAVVVAKLFGNQLCARFCRVGVDALKSAENVSLVLNVDVGIELFAGCLGNVKKISRASFDYSVLAEHIRVFALDCREGIKARRILTLCTIEPQP